jgi:hypothetical protein
MDPQAAYDQMAQQAPLDFVFSDSLLNLEEVPTINIRSNTIILEEAQTASDNFSHGSGFAWAGIQMAPGDRRAASINGTGGSTHPYSRAHSSPSSAPATSTMTLALPQV